MVCSGQLSLLPFARREMSSSYYCLSLSSVFVILQIKFWHQDINRTLPEKRKWYNATVAIKGRNWVSNATLLAYLYVGFHWVSGNIIIIANLTVKVISLNVSFVQLRYCQLFGENRLTKQHLRRKLSSVRSQLNKWLEVRLRSLNK